MKKDLHPEITQWMRDSLRVLEDQELRAAMWRTLPYSKRHEFGVLGCWRCHEKNKPLSPSSLLCLGCINYLTERSDTDPIHLRRQPGAVAYMTGQNGPQQ